MAKKTTVSKKVTLAKKVKSAANKAGNKPTMRLLENLYDVWCYKEKRFIAKGKTKQQAGKIMDSHPHPTDLMSAQNSFIMKLMENNLFEEESTNGDFNEALSKAIITAKETLKTDFVMWELQKISGQNGGFIQENIIRVRIFARSPK